MFPSLEPLSERYGVDRRIFREEIVPANVPVVLRQLTGQWPAVAAGGSTSDMRAYLAPFDRGVAVETFVGPPEIEGRFFYNDQLDGFNFERRKARIGNVIEAIARFAETEGSPSLYTGAVAIPDHLPGFMAENRLPLLDPSVAPRIWIGTASLVSSHFDLSDNIACVVAGRRRFVIFPPDQLPNLYVGPLDFTMAGQPASLAPVRDPDFERFPRFREALAAARVAELHPGDAIYIPTLWWHHVEALSAFNVLVNYWWEEAPPDAGSPFEAMVHGLLTIAHLPPERRRRWQQMFDHYVFRPDGFDPAEHIAPERRGILGTPTPALRQRIRQFLLRALSR